MSKLIDIAKGSYSQVIVDLASAIEDRLSAAGSDKSKTSDLEIMVKAAFTDFADELEDMKIKAKATLTDLDDRISKLESAPKAKKATTKKAN
jgi:hypothetical protein